MEINLSLAPRQMQLADTLRELEECNRRTGEYGLRLSEQQMLALAEHRFRTLKNTGRVEFGHGILKKLIEVFCDSPYLTQDCYEETLMELQDLFYYFKNESMESISDDELIEAMKSFFHGRAQGSLEYLAGTSLESLCRRLRGGPCEDAEDWDMGDGLW